MLCEYYYYYSPNEKRKKNIFQKKKFSFIFPTPQTFDPVYIPDDCKHSRSKKNLLILAHIPAPHHVLCRASWGYTYTFVLDISVLDIILMCCKAK